MRLLDRYLLRELLLPLTYCLGGFLILWISFDLVGQLDSFQKKMLQVPDVAEYYLVKTPEVLVQMIPMALLLALLYALTNHARHNELTAIRAAGVTLWRVCRPHLAVGLALTAGVYLMNELAVPNAGDEAREITERYQKNQPTVAEKLWKKNLDFINHHAGRIWHIEAYNLRTHEMIKPAIDWELPGGARRQIHAEGASRVGNVWFFTNVQEIFYLPTQDALGTPFKTNLTRYPELTETPEMIASEIKIRQVLGSFKAVKVVELSTAEILNYIDLHPQMEPTKRVWLLTKLHGRLALPWTCLVVVLIAIPFGVPAGRRNVFVGVAASVFLCFLFFFVREMSVALGMNGNVPPWLAGWAPCILFAATGIVLTNRVR